MRSEVKTFIYLFNVAFFYTLGFITVYHGCIISHNVWVSYVGGIFISVAAALTVALITVYTLIMERNK